MDVNNTNIQNLDKIYMQLVATSSLWDLQQDDFIRTLSKNLSEILSVDNVSVFVIEEDQDLVIQKNHYIASKQKHYPYLVFKISDFPILFESIWELRVWGEEDAANSPRLKELRDSYIIPSNISSSLYCSIHNDGKLIGGVRLDHIGQKRKWMETEKRFLCSIADMISTRLVTTKVLEEKDQRYRSIFENSSDGMFLIKDNVCIDCNDAAEELFACKREDILQKHALVFTPEFQENKVTSRQFGREKFLAALKGEKQSFEFIYKRLDGTIFPADVILNRFDSMGQTFLMTTIRDITHRRIAETKIIVSNRKMLEQNKCLALMNELSNKLQGINSIEEIYQNTLESLSKMPLSPAIAIYKVDKAKEQIKFYKGTGFSDEAKVNLSTVPFNIDLDLQSFLTKGKAKYYADLANETRFESNLIKQLLDYGIKSMVEMPFITNGERIATLYLTYTRTNSVRPEILELLFSISKTVSLALENSQSRSKLAHMAHHDSLTSLGNRALFHMEFKEKANTNAALYLLDLDRFKEINDTLGHFTGDRILQLIGPRLNSLIDQHEHLVCRLGGDEFIVLVYDIKTKEEANKIAKAILKSLRKPFLLDDFTLEIDCSVGVALYPQDGKNSHELLRSADVAMYQAKQTGSGHTLYQEHLDVHTPERLTMIAELGNSIEAGQLFLNYQPKINLTNNEVVGFEALVRWDHPRLGLLGPGLFVPLIEMSNSIFQLTEEVIHQALAQQQKWREQGHNFSVAVNLSARNLIDERIIELLKVVLDKYETPKNMLELEITETAVMNDAQKAISYLKQISDLGILISIDDFGTGYSSLAYMHKLPVHKLKLDREFIMGMLDNEQGESIVKTIISLSKTLNLDIIAEGVEDQDTLDKLKTMECDQAQGYHICKPNTWESIENWLKEKNH